jgi:integrase
MADAEAGRHRSPRLVATLSRTGLQIALLSLRFWRINEFMLLEIGKHIAWDGEHWTMRPTKPDTRSKRRFRSGRIPDVLVPHLERYLDMHRPLLCNGKYEGNRLWVSLRAQPQSENSFRDNVKKFTEAALDVALSPHDFRRSAATTMAIHNPVQIEAISRMMGHSGPRTRDEAYNMASDFSASQQWAETRAHILKRARDRRRLGRRR